jgi:integrase
MMQKCIDSCKTTQQQEIKTVLHKIFEYALEMEIVDRDPSQHLKSNSVDPTIDRIVFTSNEIAIIEQADEWWKVCLACLLYSGMRTKELRDLTADDINLDELTINIRIAKNKSSVRKIPIHTHAEPYFRAYKEEGIGFYDKTHNGFNKAIQRSFEVEHHAHDTRHTFATKMRECGCDPLILQKILGHTPQTITERVYTHLTLEEMRQNIEKLTY